MVAQRGKDKEKDAGGGEKRRKEGEKKVITKAKKNGKWGEWKKKPRVEDTHQHPNIAETHGKRGRRLTISKTKESFVKTQLTTQRSIRTPDITP